MEKTLDEAVKEAEKGRVMRYPLWDFKQNVAEIREIATAAQKYVHELNPEICEPPVWEFVPQTVQQVMVASFEYLNKRKSREHNQVYMDFGALMTIGINYAETAEADKEGTFNPWIKVGRELSYAFREEPYNDAMSTDMAKELKDMGMQYLHPMFYDVREQMKEIFETASGIIESKYGYEIPDSDTLSYVVVAFFRKVKEYLIEHKDNVEVDLEINLGRIMVFGIEKEADGNYNIYITPSPKIKMEHSKGDDITEKIKEGGN